jgi:hypothetical protein
MWPYDSPVPVVNRTASNALHPAARHVGQRWHACWVTTPKQLIEDALAHIASCVTLTEGTSPDSHTVVDATGLDDADLPVAVARYAVGFLAGWVERNATIGERLGVTGVEHRDEIRRLVDRVVSPPQGLDADRLANWQQTWRNAWIAEVVTHALFVIRRTSPSASLSGDVVGLLRPHPLPKRQGLDSVVIYDEGDLAVIAVGETKASRDRGSDELTNACDLFDDVDLGLYGPDLRNAIDVLADVLPAHLADQLSDTLWRDQRCYVPSVLHQTQFDASTRRPRLERLAPAAARKRVLVLCIADFDAFFDAIAIAMPGAVDELVI